MEPCTSGAVPGGDISAEKYSSSSVSDAVIFSIGQQASVEPPIRIDIKMSVCLCAFAPILAYIHIKTKTRFYFSFSFFHDEAPGDGGIETRFSRYYCPICCCNV